MLQGSFNSMVFQDSFEGVSMKINPIRRRMREYRKFGKSSKYKKFLEEFERKLLKAPENYIRKNIDSLKDTNPSKAYSILKKMGAKPGEFEENSTFTLPEHENLTSLEAANRIAEHFSKISREYPPLNVHTLPDRVSHKIENPESENLAPVIYEHEVFKRICQANKPKSGVPGDLPKKLVNEFGPEISVPVTRIFNNIIKTAKQGPAKWPDTWKQEFGTPLQKLPEPQSEDDLRIISLTAFFSKVMEKFVVEWLLKHISHKLDPKQFGGLKGNSISHYMIELINFILYNQDYNLPIAILAATIDFSKAFNRQNHNILIVKLSDMGVPGWLLNLVMGFLTDRSMFLRYKGATTGGKPLPGGGPQGTLLGLLLFLVLINDCGFEDEGEKVGEAITKKKRKFKSPTLHTKFVDDLTILEAINLKEALIPNPGRPQPDTYHARLGMKLDPKKSKVYSQIEEIRAYANSHEMKLNVKKCNFMVFNPTKNHDFVPDLEIEGSSIETQEEVQLLGLKIRNDLSWKSNTHQMVQRAYKRLWIIKRLKNHGATLDDLKEIYTKQVRSILEFGVPVWNNGLTKAESVEIERVQKSFLNIVFGVDYQNYENALEKAKIECLEARRLKLCTKFAKKSLNHPKHSAWFKVNKGAPNTRSKPSIKLPLHRLARFRDSPIPYLTRLLN